MIPDRISSEHRAILEDETHTKYVSSVSFWEIGLKLGLGKLKLSGITPEQLVTGAMEAGFALLAATTDQMARSYRLEHVASHEDPFDRLLIWQCIQQECISPTADSTGAYVGFKRVHDRSKGCLLRRLFMNP